ncbi:ribokinase [Riemerella columbina]|uniref:ribokinase n=1 Tax=Riemerella columbina TaxID=103810 RepID=UPI00036D6208|nr:PfkB family carbohydrate kinase [Riemerella columbina]
MTRSTEQPKIVVVGSSSIDLILKTNHHPQPGDTIMANSSENFFGGKGANQAVGTSRLGAHTYFIGSVGMDPYGQQILRHLTDENVNVGFVREDGEHETGTAYVIASQGKNAIIVAPSANYALKPKHVQIAEKVFVDADLVLTQLEISEEVVMKTLELCKKYNRKLGVYASPARKLPQELIDYASFIVAKTNDLATIFGEDHSEAVLQKLPNKLFLRDGVNSTIYYDGYEMKYLRNDPEKEANRMGMGDAFTSGFAVAMCQGQSVRDCVKFGNLVSLKVAEQRGSQKGLPYAKDLK